MRSVFIKFMQYWLTFSGHHVNDDDDDESLELLKCCSNACRVWCESSASLSTPSWRSPTTRSCCNHHVPACYTLPA